MGKGKKGKKSHVPEYLRSLRDKADELNGTKTEELMLPEVMPIRHSPGALEALAVIRGKMVTPEDYLTDFIYKQVAVGGREFSDLARDMQMPIDEVRALYTARLEANNNLPYHLQQQTILAGLRDLQAQLQPLARAGNTESMGLLLRVLTEMSKLIQRLEESSQHSSALLEPKQKAYLVDLLSIVTQVFRNAMPEHIDSDTADQLVIDAIDLAGNSLAEAATTVVDLREVD